MQEQEKIQLLAAHWKGCFVTSDSDTTDGKKKISDGSNSAKAFES